MASLSDLRGKRILVTGASGFTGRYVVAELQAHGSHVIALGGPGSISGAADQHVVADMRDKSALAAAVTEARADMVVHLAALAFVGHDQAEEFYSVNMLGTRNLLVALEQVQRVPERVLLASSANVYGNALSGRLDETTMPAPANDYAVSKLSMEHIAGLWRGRLPITITRPFNYTGVGQAEHFLVPKIVSHFVRRAPAIELGNVEVSRDFGDVRAVASAYRSLLQVPANNEVLNVCSGRGLTLMQIIEMCTALTGHRLDVLVNPEFVRANEVKTLLGSNERLRSWIGDWQTPPFEQTLAWMLGAWPH
ncbi:NAD-dependent epimerase/dehydratase family protein [Luteimonas sp. TWI1437]|uniref:NAD-dependent epimerase/dehydratase family protein n=1 Tax=unclassified Luteimonas TaxID=2629088 RepID=UPI0032086EAE